VIIASDQDPLTRMMDDPVVDHRERSVGFLWQG